MADTQHGDRPDAPRADTPAGADPRQAVLDWITIWQSELSALAADRETQEAWLSWVALWANAAQAATRLLPNAIAAQAAAPHEAPGIWPGIRPGDPAPAGPAAPVAASDPRDDAMRRLAERVAELERQLAGRRADADPGGC